MKTNYLIASLFAWAAMAACTEFEVIDEPQGSTGNGLLQELSITGKDFQFDDMTRSSVTIGENGASFAWDEDDVIGIFPDKGDQVSFAMEEGAGTQTATFTGGGWALKSSAKYAAYYPHVYENRDLTAIPVSYVSQTQNGNGNTDHIGEYDFMAAGVSTPENGAVAFDMQHLGALVQLSITVPEPSTLNKVVLTSSTEFTETGTIDLTVETPAIIAATQSNTFEIALNDVATTEANENVTVYFMTAPVDLTGSELTATVHFSDESTFDIELIGRNLQAGRAYRLTEVIPNNQIWYTADQIITLSYPLGDIETFGATVISNDYDAEKKCGVITFDGDVITIGDYALYYCTSLTSITIPDSVTNIADNAFRGCTSLTRFNGKYASDDGRFLIIDDKLYAAAPSGLIECTIPNNVTTVGDFAFVDCTSLTRFNGKYASDDGRCLIIDGTLYAVAPSGLIECTIPNSVTTIGDIVFLSCSNLKSIVIPDSVTTIGDYAFSGCTSLTSVTIPNSVTTIGRLSFRGCTCLTSITFPNCVTTIEDFAFSGCTSLTSVTIPDSVTTIGDYAFEGCTSLTSITIPDGVTSIGNSAFRDCSSLTSITIPNSVTTIGSSAFGGCTSLTSITIPNSVTTIGSGAFSDCTSLTRFNGKFASDDGRCLIIDETLIKIAPSGLIEYTIPNSVTTIGNGAFRYCKDLTSVVIPDSVTSIGDSAFANCYRLTSITIPNSVTYIGDAAFVSCSSLKSIVIPDPVTTIGSSAFLGCTSLTSITIPNSVTSIGDYAFYYCSSLTSINIPNGVTTIGDYAFTYCSSLTSITIPNSVTYIGDAAFYGCNSLTSIYCKATTPPRGYIAIFYEISSNCKIYVPKESVEAYKTAAYWSDYAAAIVGYEF